MKSTRFLLAAAGLCLLASTAASTSACTLLWVFNEDPDGLPCEIDDDDVAHCLKGYTCVFRDTGAVCLKAAALQRGEACEVSEQCDEDLVCATGYASCADNPDDVNCSTIPAGEKELACRTVCNINNATTCGADELCFQVGALEFCQKGVCATDSDCQVIDGAEGFCVGELLLGGQTGFCFEACDPLACAGGSCPDCGGVDGAPDVGANCIAVLDETLGARAMCDVAGPLEPFDLCDPFADRCTFGSFCNAFVAGQNAFCSPWCNFAGGAPACNSPAVCTQVQGALGFCAFP